MLAPATSVVLLEDSIPYARLLELLLDGAAPGAVEVRRHGALERALDDRRARGADCVLIDLDVPGALGLEAVAAVLNAEPGLPVIVLGSHDDDELAIAAIRAGAQDYLVKGQETPARLARMIRFAIERRQATERNEDLLRANEDRWRTLTHLAPVGIVETGADGQCVFANDWVSELTGRPRAGLLGLGWCEAMHREDRPPFEAAWRAAAEAAGEFALEVRFVAPDGRIRWAHVTAVVLRDPGRTGRVAGNAGRRHTGARGARRAPRPGPHRSPHWAGQPAAVGRAAGGRAAAGRPLRLAAVRRGAGPRPRQALQRPLRAPGGRRTAAPADRRMARGAAGLGLVVAVGWRRVRRAAARLPGGLR